MSDDDEEGLLVLNEGGDVVDSVLDVEGLGSLVLGIRGGSLLLGLSAKTLALGNMGLGAVLVEQLEDLSGKVLVGSLGELVDRWGDLQTLVEHTLLALKTNVLWPLGDTAEVTNGLDGSP